MEGRVDRLVEELQGLLPTIVTQVGDHVSNQGNVKSQNDNAANDIIHEDDRNVNVGNGLEVVKLQAGHSTYTDQFHKLARLVPHLVTLETKGLKVRNGLLKRSGERRGDGGELSKEGNVKGDNKRARTGKVFAIITNPVMKEYTGLAPKCTNCNFYHNLETPCRACTNYNCVGNFATDFRVRPKMVNPLNARNLTAARGVCYEYGGIDYLQGHRNNGNLTRGKAFMMEAEEARQDPNIVTASEQLVEINKVIRDCKLEIEGHTIDIDLIPFGHRSFDVIIGIDWLSRHRAKIVCHERVVQIPLLHGEMLRVYRERPEENVKRLMSAKAEEPKLEHITIVQNFYKGDEQQVAFQTLKDKLCSAPVLAFPDRPKDFM
nr:hypothetical protein [Tanacetum cinerariifolium]